MRSEIPQPCMGSMCMVLRISMSNVPRIMSVSGFGIDHRLLSVCLESRGPLGYREKTIDIPPDKQEEGGPRFSLGPTPQGWSLVAPLYTHRYNTIPLDTICYLI